MHNKLSFIEYVYCVYYNRWFNVVVIEIDVNITHNSPIIFPPFRVFFISSYFMHSKRKFVDYILFRIKKMA